MIRIVVATALALLPAAVQAKRHPRPHAVEAPEPPEPPQPLDPTEAPEAPQPAPAPQAPRGPGWWPPAKPQPAPRTPRPSEGGTRSGLGGWGPFLRFDIDIPEMPELDDLEDLGDMGDLPALAMGAARASGDSDDEDDDEGQDEDENGVHVYHMKRERIRLPRVRIRHREDELDESSATAHANGNGSATLLIKGPVTFQVRAQAGDIEVVNTDKAQVRIVVTDSPAEEVSLYAFGDRVEPAFRGRRLLRRGKLRVELPRGSRLDVSSMSGDVTVHEVRDVRVRTMSGDVKLAQVGKSEVQSISGDVQIAEASGPVRLHLVSGRATVSTVGAAPQIEFQSASGSLEWGGVCGKDCHLSAETVSGELRLAVDSKSSFELSYTSHSGELRDEVNLAVKRAPRRKYGMGGWGMSGGLLEATYGKGEGVIEADAFSGNLVVKKK